MDNQIPRTSKPSRNDRFRGQRTYQKQAETLALAGITDPVLLIPMKQSGVEAHDGLALRGRAILGLAGRVLEVGVREKSVPAHSRDDKGNPADFDLTYHGILLPGTYSAVRLHRDFGALGEVPHWRGSQAFLSGHFVFHLIHLEAALPGHGWVATMCVCAEPSL